jgi:hypothetical protein
MTVPCVRVTTLALALAAVAVPRAVTAQPATAQPVTAQPVAAQPAATWADAPAAIAAAMAPHANAIRACGVAAPRRLGVIVYRERGGATRAAMPMPPVGARGLTPTERCLGAAIAAIAVPPLPPLLERLSFVHVVTAPGAPAPPADPDLTVWRDPAATIAAVVDPAAAELAACARAPRTLRLVVDRRRGATRVWLPAWQFHDREGRGTTPPRQKAIKTCLAKVVRGWRLPRLPRDLGDLHVAVTIGE